MDNLDDKYFDRRQVQTAVLTNRVDNLEKIAEETREAIMSIAASIAKLATIEEKIDERHQESKAAFERAFDKIVIIEQRIEAKCEEKDKELKVIAKEMAEWDVMKPRLRVVIAEMPETIKVRDWVVRGAIGVVGLVFIALIALVVHK